MTGPAALASMALRPGRRCPWWLVEYDVRAGNETTTWEVEIRGNPVHLVLE